VKTTRHFWLYLAQFFWEWEMFQTKVVEEIKTYFMFSNPPPPSRIACCLCDNVEKCCRARQGHRQQWNACALHARYLGLQIHTLRLCNTCFPTATVVARMCCNVMFVCTLPPLYCILISCMVETKVSFTGEQKFWTGWIIYFSNKVHLCKRQFK
jgi:hypothetical protein